jgi:hypothetical protein
MAARKDDDWLGCVAEITATRNTDTEFSMSVWYLLV